MSCVWCLVMLEYGVPYMKVFDDHRGAVHLAKNTGTTCSKHMDIRHRFLRDLVFKKDISVQ